MVFVKEQKHFLAWRQSVLVAGGGEGTELLSRLEAPPGPSTHTLWRHWSGVTSAPSAGAVQQKTHFGGGWRPEVEL